MTTGPKLLRREIAASFRAAKRNRSYRIDAINRALFQIAILPNIPD
jgi:hypothetical protein